MSSLLAQQRRQQRHLSILCCAARAWPDGHAARLRQGRSSERFCSGSAAVSPLSVPCIVPCTLRLACRRTAPGVSKGDGCCWAALQAHPASVWGSYECPTNLYECLSAWPRSSNISGFSCNDDGIRRTQDPVHARYTASPDRCLANPSGCVARRATHCPPGVQSAKSQFGNRFETGGHIRWVVYLRSLEVQARRQVRCYVCWSSATPEKD